MNKYSVIVLLVMGTAFCSAGVQQDAPPASLHEDAASSSACARYLKSAALVVAAGFSATYLWRRLFRAQALKPAPTSVDASKKEEKTVGAGSYLAAKVLPIDSDVFMAIQNADTNVFGMIADDPSLIDAYFSFTAGGDHLESLLYKAFQAVIHKKILEQEKPTIFDLTTFKEVERFIDDKEILNHPLIKGLMDRGASLLGKDPAGWASLLQYESSRSFGFNTHSSLFSLIIAPRIFALFKDELRHLPEEVKAEALLATVEGNGSLLRLFLLEPSMANPDLPVSVDAIREKGTWDPLLQKKNYYFPEVRTLPADTKMSYREMIGFLGKKHGYYANLYKTLPPPIIVPS